MTAEQADALTPLPASTGVRATGHAGEAVPLELQPVAHPLKSGRYQTPLRYPGAKTSVIPHLRAILDRAVAGRLLRKVELLVEPFAGGASTSLRLVGEGAVERILLADADPLVASFWKASAVDSENLIDRMVDEHKRYVEPGGSRAVERWDHWRATGTARHPVSRAAILDAATKCLFLNRTTFSGILHGRAGPIGGRAQASAYPIGCRFNPEGLADRIQYVAHLYDAGRLIDVWQKDWKATLTDVARLYQDFLPNGMVAYLDPPYVDKSDLLYGVSFGAVGEFEARRTRSFPHQKLSWFLRHEAQVRWILSYDDHPALLAEPSLYAARRMAPSSREKTSGVRCWPLHKATIPVRYTVASRGRRDPGCELLIATLPIPEVESVGGALRQCEGNAHP